MNDAPDPDFTPAAAELQLSRWILAEGSAAIAAATAALEEYRFDEYAATLYKFTWNSFCDWFLEFAKPEFADRQRAYLKPLGLRDVYTPQVVVDGRLQAAALHGVTHGQSPKPKHRHLISPQPLSRERRRAAIFKRGRAEHIKP